MSEDTRRLHLRFSMQRPEQKKAFDTIAAVPPRQRMAYLCGLVNQDALRQDLERHILSAVKTALRSYTPPALPAKEETTAGEIPQNMMDFLATL